MFCCATRARPPIIPGIRIIVYNHFNYVNHFFKAFQTQNIFFLNDATMETHAVCEKKTRQGSASDIVHKKSII